MSIVDAYNNFVLNDNILSSDFNLVTYKDGFLIGYDLNMNTCCVIYSNEKQRSPLTLNTKMISVDCNSHVQLRIKGNMRYDYVHIIRCYATSHSERMVFLELCDALLTKVPQTHQEEYIVDIFRILIDFFDDSHEISRSQLQGLYAELFTIHYFDQYLPLGKYWHSKDRLKFDFSLSDKLRIEVKSTVSTIRKHHFSHDQLHHVESSIYIISYLLREDDQGLSLFQLIQDIKPTFENSPDALKQILKIQMKTTPSLLESIKYDNAFMVENMRVFKAVDVPRFSESKPTGVSNAEYDSILDGVPHLDLLDFVNVLKETERSLQNI